MICGIILLIAGGVICFFDHNWLSAVGGFGVGAGGMLIFAETIFHDMLKGRR